MFNHNLPGHHRPYEKQLCDYTLDSVEEEETFHFLGYERLHRLNIVQLQNRLARLKTKVKKGEYEISDEVELRQTLHFYTNALRDYSFMHQHTPVPMAQMDERSKRLKDFFPELNDKAAKPFSSHYYYTHAIDSHTDSLRSFLRRTLPVRATYSADERVRRTEEFKQGKAAVGVSDVVDKLARFLISFLGGAFVLVPMFIMVIHPTRAKTIVTTAAAVLLFSVALAFGVRASNVETLLSTATYAAVLMVFLGTYTGTSST